MTNAETRRLAVMMNMAFLRLNRVQMQLHALQREIDEVLDGYFVSISKRISPFVVSEKSLTTSPHPPQSDDFTPKADALNALMHQIYRRLARSCHPDVNPTAPTEKMVTLNQAYQQRELGSLMLLCQQALEEGVETVHFSLHDMQHYYDSITALTEEMQAHYRALETSDANRLRKRLLLARLHGDDVMGAVAKAMQRGAEQKAAA
jgi:hypothetical protein